MLCFFDGNGGVQSAGVRRVFTDQVDLMDQMDTMGAPRYTSRVCGAAVGYGSGKDLPQGDYVPDAPTKKQYSQHSQHSYQAPLG